MSAIPVQVAVACSHCNARYRLKEAQLKIMKEMKCLKCGKRFVLVPLPLSTPEANPPTPNTAPPSETVTSAETATLVAPSPATPVSATPPPSGAHSAVRRPLAVSPSATESEKSNNIFFKCTKCAREVSLPKAYAGKKIRCKQCSEIVTVPSASPTTSPPTPMPPLSPITTAPVAPEVTPPSPVAPPVTLPGAPPITSPVAPILAATPTPPVPLAPTPPDPEPLTLTPIDLDVKPVVPPEVQAELQTLRNQAQELERRSAEADRRATEAEKELQNLAGQRAIETVTSGRRIAELEAEIRALKNTLTQHETEAATVQQQFKDHLVGDLNAKLESRREELARYYENEFASVENRLKDLKVRREELARYFETEQAVAEARIQDIRERQKALKN